MPTRKARHDMLHDIFDPARTSPVSTAELAMITNLALWTIRRDIGSGELRAVRRRGRGSSPYRIDAEEARRYLRQLGLQPAT